MAGSRAARLGRRALAATALLLPIVTPALPPRGPVLIEVVEPAAGAPIGLDGFDLLVRFPSEHVAAETFRALLNGADVTELLTTGENGSFGHVVGLLPGDNELRLEVFGRVPFAPDRLFEQARVLHVWLRVPVDLDRG